MGKDTTAKAGNVKQVVDTLGYYDDDNVRQELEGKGAVYSASSLHPNALANGLRTGALVRTRDKAGDAADPDSNPVTLADLDDDELHRLAAIGGVEVAAGASHEQLVEALGAAGVTPPPPGV